jgi:two-component system chemotaxis response regulator CheY
MNNNRFALVIDDSISMRQYVTSILRQDGQVGEILAVENPDSALRLLQQHEGSLQVIISDWNMPGMPLSEFIETIQAQPHLAGVPVLLLTAESELKARAVAETVGAAGVLTKPFDPEQLLVLATAAIGTVDRRGSRRITPFIRCEVDLGFSNAQQVFSADIVTMSDTGILLRAPVPPCGVGQVYDIASLILRSVEDEELRVHAQILRIEADSEYHGADKRLLMAFQYENMDNDIRRSMQRYQKMYDPEQGKEH